MKAIEDIKKCVDNQYLSVVSNLNARIENCLTLGNTDTEEYEFLLNLKSKIDVAFARIDGFIDGTIIGLRIEKHPGYKIPPTNAQF